MVVLNFSASTFKADTEYINYALPCNDFFKEFYVGPATLLKVPTVKAPGKKPVLL
jgi:hypothetical protein